MTMPPAESTTRHVVHLRGPGTGLVVESTGGTPRIVHWGRDLGPLDPGAVEALVLAAEPLPPASTVNHVVHPTLVPEPGAGWPWTPGIEGHRDGRDYSPRFSLRSWTAEANGTEGGHVRVELADDDIELVLTVRVEMTPRGLVRARAELYNAAPEPYQLDALTPLFPIPARATDLLDFTGRHLRERSPERGDLRVGVHRREGRRGRTGLDATLLMAVGTPGFGFGTGEVWTCHTAWSGNHVTVAERTNLGGGLLGGGELLLPGEVRLEAGESYTTPWLLASYAGTGLDEASDRYHGHLRDLHGPRRTRPVVLNTWEAVYFDHDLATLRRLADLGARVGAERFVLDDGWFRGRRDDHAGLGDWYVDEGVWPDGLDPIVDHVRSLGMEFGLWVEPEMINVDSDTARTHPEWIMGTGDRLPPEARHQQVIDLANPDAYAYLLGRLDEILSRYPIAFLKWDHNRDLVEAGHPGTRRAGVHDQTLAAYRLMDELKRRHPGLEIESCSSGGGRADLGVLEHTDRIWASDCIDALERQAIQRWTGLVVPPEMMGSHVGAPRAHTTGRTHSLTMRAVTAMFGHFGIEWDLTSASEEELDALTAWVAIHKEYRDLLHSGNQRHGDLPGNTWVHGVVSADRAEALFAIVNLATDRGLPPGMLTLPGLDPDLTYRLTPVAGPDAPAPGGRGGPSVGGPDLRDWLSAAPWWSTGLELGGAALGAVGVQGPALMPAQATMVHLRAV